MDPTTSPDSTPTDHDKTSSASTTKRLLQVLADTEASEQNLAALRLHRSLTTKGWAVRTLALAPGRRSELGETIPVMAPARRSIAAVSQLRTEQAWADVVVLRGMATTGVARLAGRVPQRVLALTSEPAEWRGAGRVPRLSRMLLKSVEVLVVSAEADAAFLSDLEMSRVYSTEALDKPAGAEPGAALGMWLECLDSALPSQR